MFLCSYTIAKYMFIFCMYKLRKYKQLKAQLSSTEPDSQYGCTSQQLNN